MAASPDRFSRPIPSIRQINSAFSGGGSTLCGPTSAADVITYLWENGYSNFHADKRAELVNELAKIMQAGSNGVNGVNFIFGLNHYIVNNGYKVTFKLSGVTIGGDGVAKIDPPNLEKAKFDLSKGKFVFMELCLVEHAPDGYVIRGGHWVVLSGYDKDGLIINDPTYGSIYHSRVQNLKRTNFNYQGHNVRTDKFLWMIDTPRKYLPVVIATITMNIMPAQ